MNEWPLSLNVYEMQVEEVLSSCQALSRHPQGGAEDSHRKRQFSGQDSIRALPECFGIRNGRIVLFKKR
jgi:hypothetical protein